MQKINNTWYLRGNPHEKNHGLVSKPHSNLESIKCVNDYKLIPEATHKTYFLNEENNTLSEYMNIQMQHRARETLYAYLRWWICN